MENSKFSTVLKRARENAGLTQKQVFEKIGVVQSTFSSWETGKAEPPAEILINLCLIYGIKDISYFYEAFGIKTPNTPKITYEASKIAYLYDKADDRDKETVRNVLGRYKDAKKAEEIQTDADKKDKVV